MSSDLRGAKILGMTSLSEVMSDGSRLRGTVQGNVHFGGHGRRRQVCDDLHYFREKQSLY